MPEIICPVQLGRQWAAQIAVFYMLWHRTFPGGWGGIRPGMASRSPCYRAEYTHAMFLLFCAIAVFTTAVVLN
jgi:hypothetical protein